MKATLRWSTIGLAVLLVAGCMTSRSLQRGQTAAARGDWDAAVAYYREALVKDPKSIEVRLALERATREASNAHIARARTLEAQEQWAGAAAEYRVAADSAAEQRARRHKGHGNRAEDPGPGGGDPPPDAHGPAPSAGGADLDHSQARPARAGCRCSASTTPPSATSSSPFKIRRGSTSRTTKGSRARSRVPTASTCRTCPSRKP